jgi:hypothetical protein
MNKNNAGDDRIEKVVAVISGVLGQAPWIATLTTTHSPSLYQPSIYRGKELFLLLPLMVGVFATWAVLRWRNTMWFILVIFLLLVTFVYWAYDNFGPLSPIHPINWLLFYCTFALFMAALARLVIDVFKFLRRS